MGDNTRYGNPAEFDVDLHSIYAAYLGDFDSQNIDWWDASWGNYFRSFNDFLGFGWEAMVIVDMPTGRAHVAARREQIALFARMIKTRFGETLDREPPSLLPLVPAPARNRTLHRIVNLTDLASYKKLSSTSAPAEVSHLRARVRAGEPGVVGALFHAGGPDDDGGAAVNGVRTNGQGYTWACLRTTWWEKGGPPQGFVPGHGRTVMAKPGQGGKGLILEVGLAALRCANLRAVDVWPPVPDKNYRKAHYVIEEWVDRRTNQNPPTYPRAFGFGRSQFISEKSVERIVDASLGGLASHDVDGGANTLILLSVGDPQPIPLPASSMLPPNVVHLDILQFEFQLLLQAQRQNIPGVDQRNQPFGSLRQLLHHLQIPIAPHAPLGNAGNEAFYTVLAFQKLLLRDTRLPDLLFAQPGAFAQPGYMPQQDYFMPPMAPYAPAPYSPYGGLPMPPPIRPDGSRRNSASSANRTSLPPLDFESPVLPAPLSRQTTGESPGGVPRRPATMVGTSNQERQPPKTTVPRSQTVYWDDAEFSDHSRAESRPGRTRTPGNGSVADTRRPGASSNPPSSLRHSQLGTSGLVNSRSVSFHEERRPPTIRSQGSSSGKDSFGGSRSNSGTALGPSGLSGPSSGPSSGSGSGSASSGLASEGSSGRGASEVTAVPADSKVRKKKSSHSVKHLSTAFQKFWVD